MKISENEKNLMNGKNIKIRYFWNKESIWKKKRLEILYEYSNQFKY